MSKAKVAINGFGRIGRLTLRAAFQKRAEIDFLAINDRAPGETLAHLFKYDSTFGTFKESVVFKEGELIVNNTKIKVLSEKDPANLPWQKLGVEIVVESTGHFTDGNLARAHLLAGAERVIITAPAKNEDLTIVMGVNHQNFDPKKHFIISNASCTTNCLAPVLKVLDENFGVEASLMSTVHALTNDQSTLDFIHKDLRRARTAFENIIPTSTGAAQATALVLPNLQGKSDGVALRVPVSNVSLVDLTVLLQKKTTVKEVNQVLKKAAFKMWPYLDYFEEPLVSKDFIGREESALVDGLLTRVNGKLVKVFAWYDNEWGYSCRIVDLIEYIKNHC